MFCSILTFSSIENFNILIIQILLVLSSYFWHYVSLRRLFWIMSKLTNSKFKIFYNRKSYINNNTLFFKICIFYLTLGRIKCITFWFHAFKLKLLVKKLFLLDSFDFHEELNEWHLDFMSFYWIYWFRNFFC